VPTIDYEQRFCVSGVPAELHAAFIVAMESEGKEREFPPLAVLECSTRIAVSLVVSILAGRAERGGAKDADILASCHEILSPIGYRVVGLGETVQRINALGKLPGVRALLNPDALLSHEDHERSIRFHGVFTQLVARAGGLEPLLEASSTYVAVAEQLLAEPLTAAKPTRWYDVARAIWEFRNRWFKRAGGEALRKTLYPYVFDSCYELAVADPLKSLFARYWDGAAAPDSADRRLLCQRGGGIRRTVRLSDQSEPGLDEPGSAWLVDVGACDDSGAATLVGRYYASSHTWVVPWPNDPPEPRMLVNGRGRASIVVGVAAVEGADGGTLVLPVPTDIRVNAELNAATAWGWSRFVVRVSGLESAETMKAYGLAAVKQAMDKYFGGRGLDGELHLSVTPYLERPLRLPDGAMAATVAAARAVAGAAGEKLDNHLQVAILREVLGSNWRPWRDRLGWLNLEKGELQGDPLSAPEADLLLLLPTGAPHQPRKVNVRAVGSCVPGDKGAPGRVSLEQLAGWCTATTERMDSQQPNPNVAVLRHTKDQFGAVGIVAAPDHWSCGLIFPSGAPGRDAAYRWLSDRRLPHSLQLVRAKTLVERR